MSAESSVVRAKRPMGITLLVIVFYGSAALAVLSALATGDETIPSDITTLITLYMIALAWGLWKLYRWAWYATLIMFSLSVIYLLSMGRLINQTLWSIPIGVPIVFAVLCIIYLVSAGVRRVYLHNGWVQAEPTQPVGAADE